MFASFNRHTARLCLLTLVAPSIVLAFASGCDKVLSIEKPVRGSRGGIGESDGGVPERPGPAPDDAGATVDPDASMDAGPTMTCSEEMACCPDCTGADCGSDGCGGSCGDCKGGAACTKDRTCTCLPDCKDKRKVCGDDGCDGTCGTCMPGQECSEDGTECICVAQCADGACGPDGCGGSCSVCADGLMCDTRQSSCVTDCEPNCAGRECGSNGCNEGTCGDGCDPGERCNEMTGRCECVPNCVGRACGDNGCDGSCGPCPAGRSCMDGACVCQPKTECDEDECGDIDDGCGGTVPCDQCPRGQTCRLGTCCRPMACGDRCGSFEDGCGGRLSCACQLGYMCNSANTCVVMTPPPTCTAGSSVEFCEELPGLPMPMPTIDGTPDCAASLQAITPRGWTESEAEIPDGVAARYSAAWTSTGLYLYVEVDLPFAPNPTAEDEPYYCGDSVEIDVVLDGGRLGNYYRVPGGGQTVVRAPEGGLAGHLAQAYAHTGVGDYATRRDWSDAAIIGAFARTGGYAVEALITGAAVSDPAVDDWEATLSAGQRVGFDIGINVAAPPGTPADQIDGSSSSCPVTGKRLGQFYLRTAPRRVPDCSSNGDPWCTPLALCNPELR